MQTLGKFIRAAYLEHRNWKQELQSFLRQYRATPHSTTSTCMSPSEALNGRKLKTRLPTVVPSPSSDASERDHLIRTQDGQSKEKMKAYADRHVKSKECSFEVGDSVLQRQHRKNKLDTPYTSRPLVVVAKKGSMVTAKDGSKYITRNSSLFKKIPSQQCTQDPFQSMEEEDDDTEFRSAPGPKVNCSQPSQGCRRSSRIRNPPARYGDSV